MLENKENKKIKVILLSLIVVAMVGLSIFVVGCLKDNKDYSQYESEYRVAKISLVNATQNPEYGNITEYVQIDLNTDSPTLIGQPLEVVYDEIRIYSWGDGGIFHEAKRETILVTKDMVDKDEVNEFTYVEYKDGSIVGGVYKYKGNDAVKASTDFEINFDRFTLYVKANYLNTRFVAMSDVEIQDNQKPEGVTKTVRSIVQYSNPYPQDEFVIPNFVKAITNREVNGKTVGAFENANVNAVLWGDIDVGQAWDIGLIGENAFKGSTVSKLGFENYFLDGIFEYNVISAYAVEKYAFSDMPNLISVQIGSVEVDREAFADSKNLTEINVGMSMKWKSFPDIPQYAGVLYPYDILVPSIDNYYIWPEGKPKP